MNSAHPGRLQPGILPDVGPASSVMLQSPLLPFDKTDKLFLNKALGARDRLVT